MGLGTGTIELYRQLKMSGALDGITDVMELGSQDYWCPHDNLMRALFAAFGRELDPAVLGATAQQQKPARIVYEGIGLKYSCIDVDGRAGTIVMDLNFDSVPDDHKCRYGFVTNHGTAEHLVNQLNLFKVMHDLTRLNGLMLHAVPFMGYVDHGFFSYHPNLFQALARYNGYELVGMWVGLSSHLPVYVPWDYNMLECLALSPKSTYLIIAALRKLHDKDFCLPFQQVYEGMAPDHTMSRYAMVVDGEIMDANRVRRLIKNEAVLEAWQTKSSPKVEPAEPLPDPQPPAPVLQPPPPAPPAPVDPKRVLRETAGRDLITEIGYRVKRRLLG
jgi:hypothetical protein